MGRSERDSHDTKGAADLREVCVQTLPQPVTDGDRTHAEFAAIPLKPEATPPNAGGSAFHGLPTDVFGSAMLSTARSCLIAKSVDSATVGVSPTRR
jgi:hypothetical protein